MIEGAATRAAGEVPSRKLTKPCQASKSYRIETIVQKMAIYLLRWSLRRRATAASRRKRGWRVRNRSGAVELPLRRASFPFAEALYQAEMIRRILTDRPRRVEQ